LDGFGVLAAIKDDAVSADTPVVFLTARDGTKDLVEALEHGAHDYLRKPFDENELLARVRAAHRVKTLQDELRLRNGELAVMSRTDPLTGLWNRRYVEEQLPGAESLARRHGTPLSAIMIDIDHFKMINDTVGHAGGDVVLTEVARRLKGCVRTEDLLARWGGEEFLAVLPLGGPEGAMSLAERIRTAVSAEPVVLNRGQGLTVTVSAGCASLVGGEGISAMVARADAALYEAKGAGRNRVVASTEPILT
jgi:two-component system cell cycle response regulator